MPKKKSEYRSRNRLENLERYKLKYERLVEKYSEDIKRLKMSVITYKKQIKKIEDEIGTIRTREKKDN